MSFESQVEELSFNTDGATVAFGLADDANALYFMAAADIRATYIAADGTVTSLVNGTDFNVTGDGRTGAGTLTTVATLATGGVLRIWCATPIVQPETYTEGAGFPSVTHETAQDRGRMIDRDVNRRFARTVRAPDSDPPSAMMVVPAAQTRASRALGFDADGNAALSNATLAQIDVVASYVGLSGLVSGTLGALASTAALLALFGAAVVLTNGTVFATGGRDAVGDGGGGMFRYVSADVASADNGGTIRVDAQGRRWKYCGFPSLDLRLFGCVGDGVTDNSAALNKALAVGGTLVIPANNVFVFFSALNVTVAGTQLIGQGVSSALLPISAARAAQVNVLADDFTTKNFTYGSATNADTEGQGFILGGGGVTAHGVLIEDIDFQCNGQFLEFAVSLNGCVKVWVNRCNFFQGTYGVIQQANTGANTIKITNCYCEDAFADMIEFNGAGTGSAVDILIDGNSFVGSHGWPTGATEQRFVGLVSAKDVRITNNFVDRVSGDAAVHVEGSSGRLTITGNTFSDCVSTGGNDGYIYILDSAGHVTVDGNWFICNQAASAGYCLSTSSGAISPWIIFSNNQMRDLSGGHNLSGLDLGSFGNGGSHCIISGNLLEDGNNFVIHDSTANVLIVGNTVGNCVNGVISENIGMATGTGGTNFDVKCNVFDCTGYAIHADENTGLAGKPTNWSVTGNKFLGAGSGSLVNNGVDCMADGNWYASGLANHVSGNHEHNGYLQGTGWLAET